MPDCIVIGGGLIGMLTARELHKAGLNVLLLEKGRLGGESSWAGGGIISPLYPWHYDNAVNVLAHRSKALYPDLVAQLKEESGIDCELLKSGLLATDIDECDRALSWAQENDIAMLHLSGGKNIREIEPAISESIEYGLWMPDIMQVRNPKIVKALKGSFKTLNIKFEENIEVVEIVADHGKVKSVQTDSGTYNCNTVIVASGAWSGRLIRNTHSVEIEPVKGQMIMFDGRAGMLHRIILSQGHYVIPRRDGKVLAGSTLEKTDFDKSTSTQALEELSDTACTLVPGLSTCSIERQWAGLRPGTPNGIPYICSSREIEGLYLHAGHYRNGIVLGPASVQLMTELVLGLTPYTDPGPYGMLSAH